MPRKSWLIPEPLPKFIRYFCADCALLEVKISEKNHFLAFASIKTFYLSSFFSISSQIKTKCSLCKFSSGLSIK